MFSERYGSLMESEEGTLDYSQISRKEKLAVGSMHAESGYVKDYAHIRSKV